MEEQIRELKREILRLKERLDAVEVGLWRLAAEIGEVSDNAVERLRFELQQTALESEKAAVAASLIAAQLRLAHLEVSTHVERLVANRSIQARELEEHRERLKKVSERRRKIARRMIRDATDEELSIARCNGEDVNSIRERQKMERRQAKQKQDGPRQTYRGPRP